LSLWQRISQHQGDAVFQQEQSFSYEQLRHCVEMRVEQLGMLRQLVLLRADNSIETLITYLACLAGKHPVILLSSSLSDDVAQQLIANYQPNWLFSPQHDPIHCHKQSHQIAPDLAAMLTTSGSTGNAKLVRLSEANLAANADSICQYLQMTSDDRALTALPFAYSYGLSVINSHLLCGASLTMTNQGPLEREFWQLLKTQPVTQLTGVPYSYQIYDQLRLRRQKWPHLRIMTQAGGRMPPERVLDYARWCADERIAFYVMYGQTEATARMTYLPPELVLQHPDSIGVPIPQGEMLILDEQGNLLSDGVGELCYQGPNVMLGYASQLSDLALPAGEQFLRTGDLGYRNEQGLLFVTGRLKRQIKLAGIRWQLDAFEQQCKQLGWDVVCCGEDQKLCVACLNVADIETVTAYLREIHKLHPSLFQVIDIDVIPRTHAGKIDYPALNSHFGG
jgi:long-chain acyl-CoA synthetase